MKSTLVDGNRLHAAGPACVLIWLTRLPGGFSMMSAFLLSSISTRVLSSGTIRILTLVIFGLVP